MHYYQFNIGDYKSHTDHLDPIEDIAYRRMIDYCYLHENGLPLDIGEIGRAIRMRSHCEVIQTILNEFFTRKDDRYFCKRIEKEIKTFRDKSKKASASAKARWSKASDSKNFSGMRTHSERNTDAKQTQSESNANHKPLTNNHKPITNSNNKKHMSNKFDDSVQEIFTYWLNVMNKGSNTKLTKKRRDKIQTRLGEGYTVDDIKQAITNCAKSDFHMGRNGNSTIYNDLELICREGSKLEHFMHNVGQQAPPKQYGDHVERTFQNLEGVNLDDL